MGGGGGGGGRDRGRERDTEREDRQTERERQTDRHRDRQSVGTEGGGEEELPSLQMNFLYSPRGQEPGQKPSLTHLFLIPSTVPESLLAVAHRAVITYSCQVKYSVERRTQYGSGIFHKD